MGLLKVHTRSFALQCIFGLWFGSDGRIFSRSITPRLRAIIIFVLPRRSSSLLGSNVLPRCFASLLAFASILARQAKLHTVRAWMLSIALGPQLVALITRPTDSPPHRLAVRACLAIFCVPICIFQCCIVGACAAVAEALPVFHLGSRTVQRLTLRRLLLLLHLHLHLLLGVLRAFGESIKASIAAPEVARILLWRARREHFRACGSCLARPEIWAQKKVVVARAGMVWGALGAEETSIARWREASEQAVGAENGDATGWATNRGVSALRTSTN